MRCETPSNPLHPAPSANYIRTIEKGHTSSPSRIYCILRMYACAYLQTASNRLQSRVSAHACMCFYLFTCMVETERDRMLKVDNGLFVHTAATMRRVPELKIEDCDCASSLETRRPAAKSTSWCTPSPEAESTGEWMYTNLQTERASRASCERRKTVLFSYTHSS